ncbi:MAG: hypothetical protein H6661_12040 [Ardenticatenaceae bacterium]|nr:hypothetical protein [Ardenticatenaceae bacterium]
MFQTIIPPETMLRDIIGMMKMEGYWHSPAVATATCGHIITDRDVRLVANSPWFCTNVSDEDLLDQVIAESRMT